MRLFALLILSFLLLFSSCSMEKRIYSNGYHVEWKKVGNHTKQNEDVLVSNNITYSTQNTAQFDNKKRVDSILVLNENQAEIKQKSKLKETIYHYSELKSRLVKTKVISMNQLNNKNKVKTIDNQHLNSRIKSKSRGLISAYEKTDKKEEKKDEKIINQKKIKISIYLTLIALLLFVITGFIASSFQLAVWIPIVIGVVALVFCFASIILSESGNEALLKLLLGLLEFFALIGGLFLHLAIGYG